MKSVRLKKLDAFATQTSAGNPAGMVTLESFAEITAGEMQQIARELRGYVNEVGFACRTASDRLTLRYYSAEKEVLFCGHATIAILYDLLTSDSDLGSLPLIHIDTAAGSLVVENRVKEEQAVFISSPAPVFANMNIVTADIALALRIDPSYISPNRPPALLNAGLETLLVPITTLAGILAVWPDEHQLKHFCEAHGIDIVTLFTDDTARSDTSWRSRVFAPRFGYLEDPATGSGNAALGHYLLHNGFWDGRALSIEQNSERDRANIVKLMTWQEKDNPVRVLFGGSAVRRIEGWYFLQ